MNNSSETPLEDRSFGINSNSAEAMPKDRSPRETPRVLTDLLRAAAETCGNQVTVLTGPQSFSYADIELLSDRLAAELVHHGIAPGDRVIIGLPNSAEFIIACFAAWKARAVVVALDHHIKAANLQGILQRVEPAALIAESSFATKACEGPESVRSLKVLFLRRNGEVPFTPEHIAFEWLQTMSAKGTVPLRVPKAQPDDLATITYTSGTTGTPKGVMHTHEAILACAEYTQSYLQLSQSDVVMLPLPLHHVLAFRRFLSCFLAQCTLVISSNIFIMKQFAEEQPTGLVLVPSACNMLLDNFAAFFQRKGECLRYVEIGSEPISAERINQLKAILPKTQIYLTYGLTEGRVGYLKAGPNGIFDRLDSSNDGLEIRVLDGKGSPVHSRESGEIVISGSGVFQGYWGDSIETQAALKKNGFRTGDIGLVDENGRIQLMGRVDEIIKVGFTRFIRAR